MLPNPSSNPSNIEASPNNNEFRPPGFRTTLIIPGFTWGESSMEQFTDKFREQKCDATSVIVGDIYDKKITEFSDFSELGLSPQNATERLAAQVLTTIHSKGLENEPLDVVAFSYGALIYDAVVRMSQPLGWKAFIPEDEKDARSVVFMGPSGSMERDSTLAIMGRYAKNVGKLAMQAKTRKDIRSPLVDQQKRLFSEPIHRLEEAARLGKDSVDYKGLAAQHINVHVLGFNNDDVFPADRVNEYVATKQSEGSPIGISYVLDKNASHSSPLLNPETSAGAVLQLLRS